VKQLVGVLYDGYGDVDFDFSSFDASIFKTTHGMGAHAPAWYARQVGRTRTAGKPFCPGHWVQMQASTPGEQAAFHWWHTNVPLEGQPADGPPNIDFENKTQMIGFTVDGPVTSPAAIEAHLRADAWLWDFGRALNDFSQRRSAVYTNLGHWSATIGSVTTRDWESEFDVRQARYVDNAPDLPHPPSDPETWWGWINADPTRAARIPPPGQLKGWRRKPWAWQFSAGFNGLAKAVLGPATPMTDVSINVQDDADFELWFPNEVPPEATLDDVLAAVKALSVRVGLLEGYVLDVKVDTEETHSDLEALTTAVARIPTDRLPPLIADIRERLINGGLGLSQP
jgi:hypothetical protein